MTSTHTTPDLTTAQQGFSKDAGRIKTRKTALYELLADREWHENHECARVGGISFQGSIYSLRNAGCQIEARPQRGGIWEYRLVGHTAPRATSPSLSAPQRRVLDEVALSIRKVYGNEGYERVRDEFAPWLDAAMLRR